MNLLDRYIGSAVLAATLLVLSVLAGVELFYGFVRELDDIGQGSYALGGALLFVLLTLPRTLHELFPAAALLGTLLGLGVLGSHSELLAMRAAGLSLARIAWGVAKTGLLLALAATLFGEFLAPASGQYAEERRALAQTNGIALQTEHGFWARDGSRFVHIQDVLPGHQLLGVTIYVFDDSQVLRQAMHAQRGDFRGEKWVLEDVQESLVSETRVAVRRHPRVTWQTLLKPELLAAAALKPDNLSAFALRRYIDYLAANRLQTNHYELAFWGKVLQPLATGVMVFVAVPFVFGPLRSVGGGARLLAGAALGFGFYLCSEIAGHVSLVYGTPAFVAALGPILLFGLSGYWLLRRTV